MDQEDVSETGRRNAFEMLNNPNLTVVAAPIRVSRSADPARWIQSQMARFSDGTDHSERRNAVAQILSSLPAAPLLNHTRDETAAHLDELAAGWVSQPPTADDGTQAYGHWPDTRSFTLDAMPYFARRRPVLSLAQVLLPNVDQLDQVVDDVAAFVAALAPKPAGAHDEAPAGAEAAERLLEYFGDDADGIAAISIVFQTHDATAALIGQALAIDDFACTARDRVNWATLHGAPVTQTIRHAPTSSGPHVVRLDSVGAYPLTFGSGAHACPGRQLAGLLAEAVIGPLIDRRWRPLVESIVYEDRANLSLPRTLVGRLDA